MNKTTITAEPGMPQITITREFDAPRDLVFRAHADPQLLVQWLGPRDLTLTIDRYEVRDGLRRFCWQRSSCSPPRPSWPARIPRCRCSARSEPGSGSGTWSEQPS